jgi:methionyl-tRNA formyltransferase
MIINQKFYIKKLTTVVFLGYSREFENLTKINEDLNLKTIIITSEDQADLIKKSKINYKVFNKVDDEFKNFILSSTIPDQTIFISIFARYIFKKDIIKNFFKDNLINFHSSRLPLDAGGGGFSWRIMREDRIDNQLVHVIDDGIDTGPIIDYKFSLFPKKCRIPIDFENYNLEEFVKFYEQFISRIASGEKFQLLTQIKYLGRYNPRLETETHGLIDWNMNSYDLINFIDAFDEPYRGASTYLNNRNFGKLYIKKAQLHGGDSSNHPFMSGIVVRHDVKWLVVSTNSKHMLLIEEIFNSDGENLLNNIKVGDRFCTPIEELDRAKQNRVRFNSKGKK